MKNKRSHDIFQKLCHFIDEGDQRSVEALLKAHHRRIVPADAQDLLTHALHSKNPRLAYNLYRHIPLGHLSKQWYFKNAEAFMYDSMAQGREDVAAVLCLSEHKRIGSILNVACATLAANNIELLKRWQNSSNDHIVLRSETVDASSLPIVDYTNTKLQELVQKAVQHPNEEFCNVLTAYPEFLPHLVQYSVAENNFERYCHILDAAQQNNSLSANVLKTLVDANWRFAHQSAEHLAYYTALFERVEAPEWNSYLRDRLHHVKQPYCSNAMLEMFEIAYRFGGDRVFKKWSDVVAQVHPNHQEWASRLSKFILEKHISPQTDAPTRKSKM